MPITPSDALRALDAPILAATGHRTLDLTTGDASISLAAGSYEVINGGSVLVYVHLGSVVSVPASGAAEVAGQCPIPAGAKANVHIPGDAAVALHGSTASGTATIHLVRKVLPS